MKNKRKHTKEAIRKIKEARAKQIITEQHKRNISESMKGREFTKEHCMNISKSLLGKPFSEMRKLRLSKLRKGKCIGKNNGFFGKKHNLKSRKQMSNSLRGRKVWNKGIKTGIRWKHTPQSIKKIKQARAKQILPVKDTKIEVKIQNFLKQLGIEFFTHQYIKEIEHGYQCDILIPSINLVIECDGDYWHKYPIGNKIDYVRTKELLDKGFRILRLWEREIIPMQLNEFKERLKK